MLSLPFAGLISHFIGLMYPAYRSFKAIETREPGDDAQWLTYWVAFSSLEILDVVSFGIIEWVPLYYEAKIIFCLWLFLPQTQGASYLYEKHIKPFLTEYASKIDPVFAGTQEVLESENVATAIKMVEQYGPQVAEQALQAAVKTAQELAESAKETNEAKTD